MEPGPEDREDFTGGQVTDSDHKPQWSPVLKTGKTINENNIVFNGYMPQWSPVLKTGKTGCAGAQAAPGGVGLNGARS